MKTRQIITSRRTTARREAIVRRLRTSPRGRQERAFAQAEAALLGAGIGFTVISQPEMPAAA